MKNFILKYWNSFLCLDANIRIAGVLILPSAIWLIIDLIHVIYGNVDTKKHMPFFFELIVILFAVILLIIHRHEKEQHSSTRIRDNTPPDTSD